MPEQESAYCWQPKIGFYYYCSEHKPNKPESEVRVLPVSDILAPCQCMECGKELSEHKDFSVDVMNMKNRNR